MHENRRCVCTHTTTGKKRSDKQTEGGRQVAKNNPKLVIDPWNLSLSIPKSLFSRMILSRVLRLFTKESRSTRLTADSRLQVLIQKKGYRSLFIRSQNGIDCGLGGLLASDTSSCWLLVLSESPPHIRMRDGGVRRRADWEGTPKHAAQTYNID